MTALAPEVSKLTDRYQTTVPSGVRNQLKLGKGDRIRYCTEPNGRVYIEAVRKSEHDPVLGAFLEFLEKDMAAHPEHLRAVDENAILRAVNLVEGVDVDLDAPLSLDDE